MAKIAVDSEAPAEGSLQARVLAQGEGWTVSDVVCTSGPAQRPFEEQHSATSIALVVGGTFQYRSGSHSAFMTPGSLMLANAGQCFECGHEHGVGDRCVSFQFSPEFFERLAADTGASGRAFHGLRVPPIRELAPLFARASAALTGSSETAWDEFAIQLAAKTIQLDAGISPGPGAEPSAVARVTRIVRMIEAHPEEVHGLASLAPAARLSPYHFLRTFESVAGVTPHQFLLRARLRQAASRLSTGRSRILDIALDCGFGDISNFNRTFRAEFGQSPRAFRHSTGIK